jgi:hypothetical protein
VPIRSRNPVLFFAKLLFGELIMLNTKFIDDISKKISDLIAESPMADVENNLRSLLQNAFAKLDLVTREEFDVQTQVLLKTREQLDKLEQKLNALEKQKTAKKNTEAG